MIARIVLLFLFATSFGECIAQKIRIGVVNSDSVLMLLPEYRAARDTAYQEYLKLYATLDEMDEKCKLKERRIDSLIGDGEHPKVIVTEKSELAAMQSMQSEYKYEKNAAIHTADSVRCIPFNKRLARACFVAAEKNKCSGTINSKKIKRDSVLSKSELINVNADVAKELQSSQSFTTKKRVGYCNRDSLLTLVPGYQAAIDSTTVYRTRVNQTLANMDYDIARKQREKDSLESKSSPLINQLRGVQLQQMHDNRTQFALVAEEEIRVHDSIHITPIQQRLDNAMMNSAQKNNCPIVYDSTEAHDLWAAEEAEFVNVNAGISKELGL